MCNISEKKKQKKRVNKRFLHNSYLLSKIQHFIKYLVANKSQGSATVNLFLYIGPY